MHTRENFLSPPPEPTGNFRIKQLHLERLNYQDFLTKIFCIFDGYIQEQINPIFPINMFFKKHEEPQFATGRPKYIYLVNCVPIDHGKWPIHYSRLETYEFAKSSPLEFGSYQTALHPNVCLQLLTMLDTNPDTKSGKILKPSISFKVWGIIPKTSQLDPKIHRSLNSSSLSRYSQINIKLPNPEDEIPFHDKLIHTLKHITPNVIKHKQKYINK